MKRLIYYAVSMLLVIVAIPSIIVSSCTIKASPSIPSPSTTAKPQVKVDVGYKIKVYVASEKKVKEMLLEEYVKGVVAAEMPAKFEVEALKAQAVAARTYAVSRQMGFYLSSTNPHPDADVCTEFAHCQAWIDKSKAMKNWGVIASYKNWSKIERAVNETKGMIITYQNQIINPLFHSNSGGKTENVEDVWDCKAVAYLQSVSSSGEDVSSEYKKTVTLSFSEFTKKLEEEYEDLKFKYKEITKEIDILDYTEGDRVKNVKIGNITMKGTDFRKLFSLNSANFKIEKGDDNTLKITTQGNGHGVGLSQWGSNYLAKSGGGFEEILKYYYQGVEIQLISNFKAPSIGK